MSDDIRFDWLFGDGISLTIASGGRALAVVGLAAEESRLLAKRIREWQDYKDARGESRPCRQPISHMTVSRVILLGRPQ